MRTDVKIGLVCAFVIVMGAVIYFITQGSAPPQRVGNGPATSPSTVPSTAPSLASSGTSVSGGILVLPTSPTTTPAGTGSTAAGPTTAPGSDPTPVETPAVPPMGGGTASVPASHTGASGFGSPLPGGTPPAAGPSGASGSGSTGLVTSGTRTTIDFSSPRTEPSPAPGIPGFGSASGGAIPAGSTTYTIQKGDMLGTIAKRYNVSVRAIEAANPGIDPLRLKIDKVITIPAGSAAAVPAPATPVADAVTPASTTARPGSTYKIKKGDTLVTISRTAYGTDKNWQRIYQANRSTISNPDLVPVGAVIRSPQ